MQAKFEHSALMSRTIEGLLFHSVESEHDCYIFKIQVCKFLVLNSPAEADS